MVSFSFYTRWTAEELIERLNSLSDQQMRRAAIVPKTEEEFNELKRLSEAQGIVFDAMQAEIELRLAE